MQNHSVDVSGYVKRLRIQEWGQFIFEIWGPCEGVQLRGDVHV